MLDFINIIKRKYLFPIRFIQGWFKEFRISPNPVLSLEVTNVCNSRCVFCANMVMKRPRQHLDMQLFKKAVDEFVAMGGVNLSFGVCIGEPLLDPYILERDRYVRQFPQIKSLGFVTTLQWLHKFDIDNFFESGITWLCISTMFLGREKYMELFGVDNYGQVLKNIITLIEKNKKWQNKISIGFSLKPAGEPIKTIINHPDFKLVDKLTNGQLLNDVKSMEFFVDDWSGVVKLPAYLRKRPLYPRLFRPCRLLCNSLIVFSNGKVGLCPCRDFEADSDLILGDITKDYLNKLWNAQKHTSLLNDWRKKNIIPAICKKCLHYVY
jgi:radical SAM protein with 4Fe4S-binding SPASM domain